jgi:hypothetical protein
VTRAAALSAVATLVTLAAAAALWPQLGALVQAAGLGRFDPLARVVLAFAALSLLDRALARLFPPADPH